MPSHILYLCILLWCSQQLDTENFTIIFIFIWVSKGTESVINFPNIIELIKCMWALETVGLIATFYLIRLHQHLMDIYLWRGILSYKWLFFHPLWKTTYFKSYSSCKSIWLDMYLPFDLSFIYFLSTSHNSVICNLHKNPFFQTRLIEVPLCDRDTIRIKGSFAVIEELMV